MRGIPPPFRWFTRRDEGIGAPDENATSYQTRADPTKRPAFELAPWSELSAQVTVEPDGTVIAPLCGTASQSMPLTGHSPFRPLPVQTHSRRYPAPVGELRFDAEGWRLESRHLLVNGASPRASLSHGDVLETTDLSVAWVVVFPELDAPDTGWGPLWHAWSRGHVHARETPRGLALTLDERAAPESLELLRRVLQSSLRDRLANVDLTVVTAEEFANFEALAEAHRALAPPFELHLRCPPRAVRRDVASREAPFVTLIEDGEWRHRSLTAIEGGWLLDLGSHHVPLAATAEGVQPHAQVTIPWFQSFFVGPHAVSIAPRRSPLVAGEVALRGTVTPASVRVFIDELLERGDPVAPFLREILEGNLEPLLHVGFVSRNSIGGGIDLSRSAQVGGFFTTVHLTRWSGWETEARILLGHPLLSRVERVSGHQLPERLRSELPALEYVDAR